MYKKVTANDNKSYLGYFIKLVDECNNNNHCSNCEKTYLRWLFCFERRN